MTKEERIKVGKKLVKDKKLILEYSKGNISKEELKKQSIKLSMPL